MNDRRQALEKDKTRDQFLVFTNVPEAKALSPSDDSCRTSKLARLSYNTTTCLLTLKIKPHPEQDIASCEFRNCIYDEITAMNLEDEIDSLGSTTVQIGTGKEKQTNAGHQFHNLQIQSSF